MAISLTLGGERPKIKREGNVGYVLPALAIIAIFFVVPVLMLLIRSVLEPQLGLQNYAALLGSTTYLRIFLNTFIVAGVATVVSVLLGYPVAWLLAIMPERWSRLVLAIIVLSMWTNLLARTYAWMVLLQRTGVVNKTLIGLGLIDKPLALVNNLIGVTIGMTYIMLPFMILPLLSAMRSIDPTVLRAASVLGANPLRQFIHVYLPLSMPGVSAGAALVFITSLGFFITPALLGGAENTMIAVLIEQQANRLLNWPLASALATILLAITTVLYLLYERVSRRVGGAGVFG